ncbi:MAG: TauD/TfdA family dioxygenase [Alteromonadaceae bacterium]|nr:TauD/TfdA family dioxygenase [Alteromonadaceae bacterium]
MIILMLDLTRSRIKKLDKAEVEAYCNDNDIQFEWLENNGLRTRQINQAVMSHPKTGEKLWFNQAHLFHVSNLKPEVRESLLSVVGEESLPRNVYYGDGSEIDTADLDVIREVYLQTRLMFAWQKHDLLLLDNMLFSHARQPFEGTRKVLVGMAQPYAG